MQTKELAKQLGISHQMANRYKAKGMPTDSLAAAIAWRKRNIHPFQSKTGRIGGNQGVRVKKQVSLTEASEDDRTIEELQADVNNSKQLNLDVENADELYKNSRALKEKALALQAAAEHEKFIGALVEKVYVEKVVFERGRQFRDGLMSLSRRLAPILVGLNSVVEAEKLLNSEFRNILEKFARLPVIEE